MGQSRAEEHLLVARARIGDARAFEALVFQYTPRLRWFATKLGLSTTTADDVVQESWLAAWSGLARLRDVRQFRSWLYGTARNKCLQQISRERQTCMLNCELAAEEPDDAWFDQYLPYIGAALENLPPIHSEILALRFLEGMTYQELAEVVQANEGTIKSRLHHAKRALRKELEVLANEGSRTT